MNGVLALRGIRVQNANAVAGFTFGFPAPSGFLGFVEALDRRLRGTSGVDALFDGCAIVCHSHRTLTDSHYGVHQFCLARRPVQPDGRTAPFVEEGRMHISVTLLLGVREPIVDFADEVRTGVAAGSSVDDLEWFKQLVDETVPTLRLAGGTVLDVRRVEYEELPDEPEEARRSQRKMLMRSLPGFALVDRSDLLPLHHKALRDHGSTSDVLEAWMDFGGLRFRPKVIEGSERAEWERVALPETGWFVPIATGYRAIAPLSGAGVVVGARDSTVPFVPVESVYGVGQWLSPHRARDVESLLWRYEHDGDGRYSFINRFDRGIAAEEEDT